MSDSYDAAAAICGPLEEVREELEYIGKQLNHSNRGDRRERIATAALPAFLAVMNDAEAESIEQAVYRSVFTADALIACLNKGEPKS